MKLTDSGWVGVDWLRGVDGLGVWTGKGKVTFPELNSVIRSSKVFFSFFAASTSN